MCILCVASRWSRRIVTMLPWLIIPLIILWALSQLLPPGFRFEVTSPRLACVGVLLVSLGWYELAMPRLSMWRARRSALLRERRRIEAQEAAKWRKEATRRCRNCLSAYRDQSPAGARFMCTYCGHVSKRPVLDVPSAAATPVPGPPGMGQPVPLHVVNAAPGAAAGTGAAAAAAASAALFAKNGKGWNSRGWPERGAWTPSRGWTNGKSWPSGVGVPWGTVSGGWSTGSWQANGWPVNNGGAYWAGGAWSGGGAGAGAGFGSYGGGFFTAENCGSADPHYARVFCGVFRVFPLLSFFRVFSLCYCLMRRSWAKMTGDTTGDDATTNGNRRRGSQRREEDVAGAQGTKSEKARRKAEEKKQARLEREQLEAEEQRQREEVARLVEERRRLRDEKLEAERESEREAAAEREREIRREREAERRRQEKLREKEKEIAKEKVRDVDSEDSKHKRKERVKDVDKKVDGERRADVDRKLESRSQAGPEYNRKGAKGMKGFPLDVGVKGDLAYKGTASGLGKVPNFRYQGPSKGALPGSKNGLANQSNSYFWRNSTKSSKGAGNVVSSVSTTVAPTASGNAKPADSSCSAWKVWPKVWGKGPPPALEGSAVAQPSLMKPNDVNGQSGAVATGMNGSRAPDLVQVVAAGGASELSAVHTKPWQRLAANSTAPPLFNSESRQQQPESCSLFGSTDLGPNPNLASSLDGGSHGHASTCLSSLSVGSSVHVPASSPVLPPISAPASGNAATIQSSIPIIAATSVLSPIPSFSTGAPASSITPAHGPVSASMQVPASLPLPITSVCQDGVQQDQLPKILEPWATPKVFVENLDLISEKKWQMWEAPQLDQIQLPLVDSWMPFEDSQLEQQKETSRPLVVPLENEIQWSSSLFSPIQPHGSPGRSSCDLLNKAPLTSSTSLWSDQSAFATAVYSWEDTGIHEPHQQVPAEFVDCITQEVMLDPVITADGHSYERSAIEQWLKSHDTSPITGEVLPPPPGGNGLGVDKTLRPNHILRGQIIEYNERLARGSGAQDARDNGWRSLVGTSPWSVARSMDIPQIGSFYTAPGAQSVWSYNSA